MGGTVNPRELLPNTSIVPLIVDELDEPVLIPKKLESLPEFVADVRGSHGASNRTIR